jgi:soluble lytic murein transglycosylase-like protein
LLSASMVMASQGVVPVVQAKPLAAPTVEAPVVTTPKEPKKQKKHHHKKKKPKTIKGMIEREFGKHADEALRIAFCESRFDTDDVSSAGAVGVFQIRPVDHGWRVAKVRGKDLFDPWTNVRVAHHIYEHQGWGPWVCARMVGLSSGRRSGHRRQTTSTVSTWSPNNARRRPRAPRQPGDGTMSTWQ